eukprot:JP441988.1.p1 GENE.JP441988.1~~JP441988.1.p1  ORF type:complete len:70 (+),score=4.94 JP441988.1:55-264(+)
MKNVLCVRGVIHKPTVHHSVFTQTHTRRETTSLRSVNVPHTNGFVPRRRGHVDSVGRDRDSTDCMSVAI